jgi:N-acetylmuramoyl-L-alanine amidase
MFELIQDNYLDQSLRFASTLQTNFKNLAQRRDREVRQAGFLVLRETSMPSVLVEVGYLSNKSENSFLMTDAGRSEIARAIFGSTIDYLNLDDSNNNQEVGNDQRKLSVPQVQEITPVKNPSSRIGTVETVIKGRINEEVNGSVKQQGNSAGKQTEIEPKITYAIQIGVFTHRVGLNSKYFKGITPIKEISYDGKFKYFCSESKTFQTTKSDYIKIARLFPDAFVVSIQNNQTKMVWKNGGPK